VWYATYNIPIPCFVCAIWDDKGATWYPQRAGGYGCHAYKRIALSRAITEAAQSRLTHVAGARDDMYWNKYICALPIDAGHNPEYIASINSESCEILFDSIPEAPPLQSEAELLNWLLQIVWRNIGVECFVVDLSKSTDPMSVVHVIVPGLEVNSKTEAYSPGPRMVEHLRRYKWP
jgi:YcaO-like protein with predicted kinase domain